MNSLLRKVLYLFFFLQLILPLEGFRQYHRRAWAEDRKSRTLKEQRDTSIEAHERYKMRLKRMKKEANMHQDNWNTIHKLEL